MTEPSQPWSKESFFILSMTCSDNNDAEFLQIK